MFDSSFVWFTGVVEDVMDPEKMGRVRVRVFGLHTDSKVDIPTEDLPWSTVMLPTTSSGTSGIGQTPHFLVQGSWVVGFFRDGNMAQDPIIMGSIGTMQTEKVRPQFGFSDPDGVYPYAELLGESDVNRLARSEDNLQLTVQDKKDTVTVNVSTANGANGNWSEPPTPYAALYPKNHVFESEVGHITEIDDTDGAERIHEYHASGTFKEIHPDGSKVTRVVMDDYEITYGDKFINVKGNVNLTVDQNCTTYIKGNWDVQVDGNMNVNVSGYKKETVSGDWQRNSGTHISDNAPRIDHN